MKLRLYCILLLAVASQLGHAEGPASSVANKDLLGDPLPTGARVRIGSARLHHTDPIDALACSRDGKWLASYCRFENFVAIWAADTGKLRCRLPVTGVSKMAFAPDGNTLALLLSTNSFTAEILIECWDLAAGVKISRHRDEERYAGDGVLEFSPDGQHLLYRRSTLRRLEWANGKVVYDLSMEHAAGRSGTEVISALAQTGDGATLITAEGDNSIRFRDAKTGKERCRIAAPAHISHLALAVDGKLLALASTEKTVEFWPMPSVAEQVPGATIAKRRLSAEDMSAVIALAFSRDGKNLLTLGMRGDTRLWDSNRGTCTVQRRLPVCRLGAVAFDAAQRPLALIHPMNSRTLAVWDVAAGTELMGERNIGSSVTCLTYSPDGKTLALGSDDQALHFYKTGTGELLGRLTLPGTPCQADFNPDGNTLVAGGGGQWWQVKTPDAKFPIPKLLGAPATDSVWLRAKHEGRALPWKLDQIDECTLTPDGFVLDCKRGKVQVLESATGNKVGEASRAANDEQLAGPGEGAITVIQRKGADKFQTAALALDRRTLVVLHDQKIVALDELSSGQEIERWEIGQEELIRSQPWLIPRVALASGGRLMAVGTPRGSIFLYDLSSGQQVHKLSGHRVPVAALVFAPDGKSVACAYRDTTVLLWDLPPPFSQDFVGPQLPPDESWIALSAAEAPLAWKAHWALVSGSAHTVGYLQRHLQPARPVVLRPTGPLVQELNSPQFAVRQQATKDLEAMGKAIETELRAALKSAANLETQRRLESILAKLDAAQRRQVQELRAVAVLEQIGGNDAKAVLENLAGGDPTALLTRAAHAALLRQSARK